MKKDKAHQPTNIFGVGLRSPHYSFLENTPKTKVGWFEVISENYMRTRGRPRQVLDKIRSDYPIACHGVSLSIASFEEFDWKYLEDLKNFFEEIEPFLVSDHLCFTGLASSNLHNLLPFAYTSENLKHVADRIDRVQNVLGRQMAFENLSAYFNYKESTMTEAEFIKELGKKTDCHFLLDLNNIIVNSHNNQFDPLIFLESIDLERVKEIHMAGFSVREGFYFDTHSNPIYPELIYLYENVLKIKRDIPVLYEWDEDIPEFEILEDQIIQLKKIHESKRV